MKYKIINDKGEEEEVEAFSQEEVDQIKGDFETKLTTAEGQKKELEDKINGVKDDHPNFKVLKEALDKKDKEITDFKTTYENDKKQSKSDFEETIIKSVAKNNEDFKKKIKYHLENTVSGMNDNTKEGHQKKLEAAIKLASDNSSEQSVFDMGMTGGGGRGMGGGGEGDSAGTQFSSKEKTLGNKLGISEDDYKKYSSRVSKK